MGMFDTTTESFAELIGHTKQSVGRIDTLLAQFLKAATVVQGTFDGNGARAFEELHGEGMMRGRRMQNFLDSMNVGQVGMDTSYIDGDHQMTSNAQSHGGGFTTQPV